MNYLLDTNVISAVAPTKRQRPDALVEWLDQASNGLYLSVVTAAEVRDGIAKLKREGASLKARNLSAWWDAVEHLYGKRILAFDLSVAQIAGKMMDAARSAGHAPGFADVVIAATAHAHGLTIASVNIKHFKPIYSAIVNPFDVLPPLPVSKR